MGLIGSGSGAGSVSFSFHTGAAVTFRNGSGAFDFVI
jgi:hypothetical protein